MILRKAEIFSVLELENDFVKEIFMTPYSKAGAAVDEASNKLCKDVKVIIMTYGGPTLSALCK